MPNSNALIKNENQIAVVKGENLLINKIKFAGTDITAADAEIATATVIQKSFTIKEDPTGGVVMEIPLNAPAAGLEKYKKATSASVEIKIGAKLYSFEGVAVDATSEAKKLIFKNLKVPKKFKIDILGTITIGTAPKTSVINVNAGNNNPNEDWIIQTVDNKTTGAPSNVNVSGLLDWMKGQIPTDGSIKTELSVPEKDGQDKSNSDIGNFDIDINELKLNLSQATFRVNLTSKEGTTLILTKGITLTQMKFQLSYDYDARIEDSYDK